MNWLCQSEIYDNFDELPPHCGPTGRLDQPAVPKDIAHQQRKQGCHQLHSHLDPEQLCDHLIILCLSLLLLVCPILALISLDFHRGKSASFSGHYACDLKQRHL